MPKPNANTGTPTAPIPEPSELEKLQIEEARLRVEAAKLHLETMQKGAEKLATPPAASAPAGDAVVNPFAPRRISELAQDRIELVENTQMGTTMLETKARHQPTGWDYGWAVNPNAARRKANGTVQAAADYASLNEFINDGYRAVHMADVTANLEFAQKNDIFCFPNVFAGPNGTACYMDLMLMARPRQVSEDYYKRMHDKTKDEIKTVQNRTIAKADVPQAIKDGIMEEAEKRSVGLKQITGQSDQPLKSLRFAHEFKTDE